MPLLVTTASGSRGQAGQNSTPPPKAAPAEASYRMVTVKALNTPPNTSVECSMTCKSSLFGWALGTRRISTEVGIISAPRHMQPPLFMITTSLVVYGLLSSQGSPTLAAMLGHCCACAMKPKRRKTAAKIGLVHGGRVLRGLIWVGFRCWISSAQSR